MVHSKEIFQSLLQEKHCQENLLGEVAQFFRDQWIKKQSNEPKKHYNFSRKFFQKF